MPLGIDVGGTKIAYGEVEDGNIIWKKQIPTPKDKETIVDTLKDIISQYEGKGIGIGIPGQVKNGYILFTPNIPLSETSLQEILEKATDKKITIVNDANSFLIAEHLWGAGKNYKNLIGITLGTGIGGAILLGGQIWEGAHGAGAEFGHMAIMEDGPMCGCGSRGCIEAIASPHSIEKWIEEQIDSGFVSGKTSYTMAEVIQQKDNDTICRLAYDRFIRFLGMAIANLVNIIDPEAVIIGGSGVLSWDIWKEDAYKIYNRRVLPSLKGKIPWLKAHFLSESGIVGAAASTYLYKQT